jgi:exonuclease III
MTNKNSPFKDHLTLSIGGDLRVCHFNIEGISKSKCAVLSKIMNKERVDVIALQETHTLNDEDIGKREFIQGYLLLRAIHHKQYGVATYIKEYIDTCRIIFEDNQDATYWQPS